MISRGKLRSPLLLAAIVCAVICTCAAADNQPADLNAQTQTTGTSSPAQSNTTDNDDNAWHVAATPYIWFPGLSGTTGALGHNVSVHATPGDLLSHFDIGLAGTTELRKNRLVIPIDFMWIKMSADHATPFDPGVSYARLHITQLLFTPGIGYRIIDHEKIKVDARIGARYWHLGQNVTFYPAGVESGFSPSANWVDAVAGAKIQAALSPKVLVTIVGDAGGGGANIDYQAVGLLGFKVSQKVILQAGWRYLDVDYHTNPPALFLYDVHMSGAIIGATINFK